MRVIGYGYTYHMENYFAKLLLTSELDDPIYFAKVHHEISELEKQRVSHFNQFGPINSEYITLMGELNMAYLRANDSTNELEVAKQIYESTLALYGEYNDLTIEAQIALASSYLDDGRIKESQEIANTLLKRDWSSENGPAYDLYLDTICLQADIHHKKELFEKELPLRLHVMSILEEFGGSANNQTIMARTAVAFCLERMKRYREALDHYIVIRSYLDAEKTFSTDAERIGLMAHIARCYHKIGNEEDSLTSYQWALKESIELFGHAAPLTVKMKKLTGIDRQG